MQPIESLLIDILISGITVGIDEASEDSIGIVKIFREKVNNHIPEHNGILVPAPSFLKRLDIIEIKQLEADKKFETIFKELEGPRPKKAVSSSVVKCSMPSPQ